jgi:protein-L-isoaspartate(D-aspartate) O-methyltransferase
VNAGATRPAASWLDGLQDGGRLIVPLTTDKGFISNDPPVPIHRRGAVFRIERRGGDYLARWLSPMVIFPCESARDPQSEAALASALDKGGWTRVTRLYRNEEIPEDRCWLSAPGLGPGVLLTIGFLRFDHSMSAGIIRCARKYQGGQTSGAQQAV